MPKILLATNNLDKVQEFQSLLENYGEIAKVNFCKNNRDKFNGYLNFIIIIIIIIIIITITIQYS